MTNFVQQYRSTDLNAPPLTGQAGSLLDVLNACLVDGYAKTGIAVTSITHSTTTATATLAAADVRRLQVGSLVTISGATGADAGIYNGTFPIATIASTTTVTWTLGSNPAGNATGTLLLSLALPITSVTRVGSTATLQLANANTTLVTGNYLTIAGFNETEYNGTFPITVADSTHVSYTVTGTPATPGSGSGTYGKAPLAWTRPFAGGTNKQSYRSADASSNQFYLQVNDNAATAGGAKEAAVYGAEVLTADDVPNNGGGANTGRFPTVAQLASGVCWYKSSTADTTQRPWALVGDDRTFHFFPNNNSGTGAQNQGYGFGHFITHKASDGFNTFIVGGSTFNNNGTIGGWGRQSTNSLNSSIGGFYIARSYSQIGSAINGSNSFFGQNITLPSPVDAGFYVSPLWVGEAGSFIRGRIPGLYPPLHTTSSMTNYDTITNITGLSGVTLTIMTVTNQGSLDATTVDVFGPWT